LIRREPFFFPRTFLVGVITFVFLTVALKELNFKSRICFSCVPYRWRLDSTASKVLTPRIRGIPPSSFIGQPSLVVVRREGYGTPGGVDSFQRWSFPFFSCCFERLFLIGLFAKLYIFQSRGRSASSAPPFFFSRSEGAFCPLFLPYLLR